MQASILYRRSPIFVRSFLGQRNGNGFVDQWRFQSGIPQTVNLLNEPVHALSVNPIRFYVNLWRMARFRSKYDMSFKLEEFQVGCKTAFAVVSRKLYEMDFEGLRGLISEEALSRLRPVIEKLSAQEREMLNLKESDVYGEFLWLAEYQKSMSGHDLFAITMAFHSFLDMDAFRQQNPAEAQSISSLLQNADRFVLANVKFAKRLSPSLDTDWTIIYANYARAQGSNVGFPPMKQ